MWKITHIYEADFGCEERNADELYKCIVYLENENKETLHIEAPDEWLTQKGLDVGSIWPDDSLPFIP